MLVFSEEEHGRFVFVDEYKKISLEYAKKVLPSIYSALKFYSLSEILPANFLFVSNTLRHHL